MAYTFDNNIFSDLHKDVYGYRPSIDNSFYSSSEDQKQIIWDKLVIQLKENMEEERRQDFIAEEKFAKLIENTINFGASDVVTAIRWILDGEGFEEYDYGYGADYVAHRFNMSYQNRFRDLINRAIDGIVA